MEVKSTKVCKMCNQEKPLEAFGKSAREKDGLYFYCKECTNRIQRERRMRNKVSLKKVFANPDLASFQPRELIAELRARGYSGELTFTQRIVI